MMEGNNRAVRSTLKIREFDQRSEFFPVQEKTYEDGTVKRTVSSGIKSERKKNQQQPHRKTVETMRTLRGHYSVGIMQVRGGVEAIHHFADCRHLDHGLILIRDPFKVFPSSFA